MSYRSTSEISISAFVCTVKSKRNIIAEVLGCRPGLRRFLQGLMGVVSSYVFGFRAFVMFNLHWA
nr:MAG TPA: hypothetical protein [Caudoviricetes sp.]